MNAKKAQELLDRGKLVKVTMEYENGSEYYLKGKVCQQWLAAANSSTVMSFAHGGVTGFENIEWKKVRKTGGK
jgi:hypothetical protein